jgi:hypothetical protein
LKAELDGAGELVATLQQQPCRGEEDRSVAVVAAGVHDPRVYRAVGDRVVFLDWERIDICP